MLSEVMEACVIILTDMSSNLTLKTSTVHLILHIRGLNYKYHPQSDTVNSTP